MPGWNTTLKAQGYTSYVDLQLAVQQNAPTLHAGTSADFLVTLTNAGPADANRARTIALVSGASVRVRTGGCREDPVGFPVCQFAMPLPAGATADYLLSLGVPPAARGHLDLAVAAISDDVEAAPGQELVLLDLPIEAHVNLHASASCARSFAPKGLPVACSAVLSNSGEAAVMAPRFSVSIPFGTLDNIGCTAPRPQLCPANGLQSWTAGELLPGEAIELTFDMTVDSEMISDTTYLSAAVYFGSGGEIDDAPYDYYTTLALPVPLFRDDFDRARLTQAH